MVEDEINSHSGIVGGVAIGIVVVMVRKVAAFNVLLYDAVLLSSIGLPIILDSRLALTQDPRPIRRVINIYGHKVRL